MANPRDRRKIHWDRFRSPKNWTCFLIATALGSGLAPLAPGTAGSLVTLPLIYYMNPLELTPRLIFWSVLFIAAVWAATRFDQINQTGDNQNIVIDEVLGMGISAWTAGQNFTTLVVAFVLFRVFDSIKPWPIRIVDAWSKDHPSPWTKGLGVNLDDIIAGFISLALVMIAQKYSFIP